LLENEAVHLPARRVALESKLRVHRPVEVLCFALREDFELRLIARLREQPIVFDRHAQKEAGEDRVIARVILEDLRIDSDSFAKFDWRDGVAEVRLEDVDRQ